MVFSPITLPDFKHFQMKDFPKSVMIFLLSNSQWITLHILVQYPLQHKPTSFIHNTCKQLLWPLANCWMQNHNFLLNLTPASFAHHSRLYLECQETVNPYPYLWFMILCLSTIFLLLNLQLWVLWLKVPPLFTGQEPFCIFFSEPFAALVSFWR